MPKIREFNIPNKMDWIDTKSNLIPIESVVVEIAASRTTDNEESTLSIRMFINGELIAKDCFGGERVFKKKVNARKCLWFMDRYLKNYYTLKVCGITQAIKVETINNL